MDAACSTDDTVTSPDGTNRHLWASFAEREPNISSQLGVAERSALSEASAVSRRTEISQKRTPAASLGGKFSQKRTPAEGAAR